MNASRLPWKETRQPASRISSLPTLRSFRDCSPLGISGGGMVPKLLRHHPCRQGLLTPRISGSATGHSHRVAVSIPRTLDRPRSRRLPEWKIEEIVRTQVKRASQLYQKETEPYRLGILNSVLYEEITSRRFPRKLVMSSFDCYSGATYPIQHLRQYQDKMAVHSHDDSLLSRVFLSSLKGVAYDWFYTLPR